MMYDTEPMKPSNTGRLIADILPDTLAYQWSRTTFDDKDFLENIACNYQPMVVFPASYAQTDRTILHRPPLEGKPPLFIMLDGTWSEARKMFRKSPWLESFPVISVNVSTPSQYTLREAHSEAHHCTAEIAAVLLAQAGDAAAAQQLSQHFSLFRERYLAGKPHHPIHTRQE